MISWTGIILLVALALYLRSVYSKHFARFQSLHLLPKLERMVPWNLPYIFFFSQTEDIWTHFRGFGNYTNDKNMFVAWLFGFPYVLLYGADQIEDILKSKNILKSREYDILQPWMENGLITNNTDSWKMRRKLLTPTFHWEILENYVEVFKKETTFLLKRLTEKAESKECFDIWPMLTAMALDSICETMIGRNFGSQLGKNQDYAEAILSITDIMRLKMQKPWLRLGALNWLLGEAKREEECLHIIHKLAEEIIDEKWKQQEENKFEEFEIDRKKIAFLDLLVKMGMDGQLKKSDIKEELNSFIFAGHDTTTMGLCWTLFLLGLHPEYQKEVQAELDTHIHSIDDYNVENMKNLVRLEQCFKEGIRLYPPVPAIARQVTESGFTISDVDIPVGSMVGFTPFFIHRDPKHWPDPERFDPDRFLPENTKGRHPFCYVPFSAGSRNCIGQRFAMLEAKIVIGTILQNFNIKSKHRRHQVDHLADIVLRPVPGIFVTLEKR